jgi:hypothetical protein
MRIILEIKQNDELQIECCEGIGDNHVIHLQVNNDLFTLDLQKKHLEQLIKELQSFYSAIDY